MCIRARLWLYLCTLLHALLLHRATGSLALSPAILRERGLNLADPGPAVQSGGRILSYGGFTQGDYKRDRPEGARWHLKISGGRDGREFQGGLSFDVGVYPATCADTRWWSEEGLFSA